jgi:hypothetical protein
MSCTLTGPHEHHVREVDYQGRKAIVLSNGVIELTVLKHGGAFASIVLNKNREKINPFWDSIRDTRETGRTHWQPGWVGHFVCVDGFGPASADEAKAGFPTHGEAAALEWITESSTKKADVAEVLQSVQLPKALMVYRRSLRLVDGEAVVYVHSSLENLLSFDRPVNWAEHATVGSPFLEPGVTATDISRNRALTRPDRKQLDEIPHRLPEGEEFTWPLAPTVSGKTVDLRVVPLSPNSMDHTGHLLDPASQLAFTTVLNPSKRLLLGYVFRTSDYPWLQTWEFYPSKGVLARGLEFGMQVFDRPRRALIEENKLFDTLQYRWLPAKGALETAFLFFWTITPEGFHGVDTIELNDGQLHIIDKRSNQILTVNASLHF